MDSITEKVEKPNGVFGIRHLEVFLLFVGHVIAFSMRVNMSVAIVAMTDTTSTSPDVDKFPEWSKQTQDVILSSFFWGYTVMQLPSGLITQRFGEKLLLAISLTVKSLVCLILPISAVYGGWQAVCACRVMQGLTQAPIYPSTHGIIAKWAPISERSRLSTYIYGGSQFGTIIELIVAGLLGGSLGWPSIFYTGGIAGMVWVVFWITMSANSPSQHRWITEKERLYIEESTGNFKEQKNTPWKAILTTMAFWAMLLAHCGQNWGYYTLLTEIPTYMSNVLGVQIKSNGLLSALPYLAMYLAGFLCSFLSDYIVNNNLVTRTAARKIFNTIAHCGPAIMLISLSYVPSGDVSTAVTILTITLGLNACQFVGFSINHIDLSPNFAPLLMGLTNTAAGLMSIIAPLTVGLVITDKTQASEWRVVFFIAAAIYIIFNAVFVIFGAAEVQSWNDVASYIEVPKINKDSPTLDRKDRESAVTRV